MLPLAILIIVYIVICELYEIDYREVQTLLLLASMLLYLFLMYAKNDLIAGINKAFNTKLSNKAYATGVFLPAMLLILTCMKGHSDGKKRYDNISTGFQITNSIKCKSNKDQKYIYITTLSERAISISSSNKSICITDEKSYTLQPISNLFEILNKDLVK